MGVMDTIKGWFGMAKDEAAAREDQVTGGIDKVADVADDKTGGKYSDHIDEGAEQAKDFVEGLDGDPQG
jgi:MT0933-like antitoxin protein